MAPTIGILAGEPSGDRLGAGLMTALRARRPDARFVGIGGERMLGAGLEPLAPMELLAVNGFIEPLRRLPKLARLLRRLLERYEQLQPDAFIGVDFNVFNLLVERLLRRRGIATAHYVSPSVYAWRAGRVRRVARAAELLLTLYPFEPAYYAGLPVRSICVGHPLADEIGSAGDDPEARRAARRSLGIDEEQTCIAVLPGSRMSEVSLMLTGFLAACGLLRRELGDAVFAVPCLTPAIEAEVRGAAARLPDLPLVTYLGDARRALTACDGAIVKSGTGTLEAMLLKRPMVVSYRLGEVSFQLVRRLLKTPYVALPNILAGKRLVPELLQHDATPEALASALVAEMSRMAADPAARAEFDDLGKTLRGNADARAATAVLDWLEERAHGRG